MIVTNYINIKKYICKVNSIEKKVKELEKLVNLKEMLSKKVEKI